MFIEISFLRNFRGAADTQKKVVEWPPSPYRLFCALVEAFYNRYRATGSIADKDAIKSLESSAPIIFTEPNINKYEDNMFWCPKNIGEKENYNLNPTNNAAKLTPFVATNKMYYLWNCHENLNHIIPWVSRLGTGESIVQVSLNKPTGIFDVWTPNNTCQEIEIRCPYSGILNDLDNAYNDRNNSHEVKPVRKYYLRRRNVKIVDGVYEEIPKQDEFWESLYIRSLLSDATFSIYQTIDFAKAMRIAVGKKAHDLKLYDFEEEIFSHEHKHHIAFVPLPFVNHPKHANGYLKGIAILLPKAIAHWRDKLEQCLHAIERIPLNINGEYYDDILLTDVTPSNYLKTTDKNTWNKASYFWSSATPVGCLFLNTQEKLRKWCERECAWLGLPKPVSIESHRYSFWGFDSRELIPYIHVSSNKSRTQPFLTNFTLEFPVKVSGPIILGKERNIGMGLMFPNPPREHE